MKVLDINDVELVESECDLKLGHLVQDFITVAYHEAVPPTGEVGHTRVIVEFTDGSEYVSDSGGYPTKYFNGMRWIEQTKGEYAGKVAKHTREEYVIDKPYDPGQEAWYENEPILRYIPYTQEELDEIAAEKASEEAVFAEQVRKEEEYVTLCQTVEDLTIVQAEQIGAYNEVDDLTLVIAELIGA